MKLELLAAGTRPPEWVSAGFNVYRDRMPPECQLILTECANAKRSKNGHVEAYQRAEDPDRLLAERGEHRDDH